MRNTIVESGSSSPILVVENISKAYSGTPVLSDLTFSAMPGDLTVVYGPPAAGKSVLVRVLTGLEQPDSGRIILRGQDVTHEAPAERNIGYVPQSFALYPHLSVRSNISYPLDLAHVPSSESREVVATAAAMLKIEEHLDKKPDQLSGGQKQRVAIARGSRSGPISSFSMTPWRDSISSCESNSSTICADSIRQLAPASFMSRLT